MEAEKKRSRSENPGLVPSLYSVRISESFDWKSECALTSNTMNITSFPSDTKRYLAVRCEEEFKLMIEAVELGDRRLELLYQGALEDGKTLLTIYSPALYFESKCAAEYYSSDEPFEVGSIPSDTLLLPEATEEMQDAFAESCTFQSADALKSEIYTEALKELKRAEFRLLGPADACRMGSVQSIKSISTDILFSKEMLRWLQDITGLELSLPSHPARIWRLEKGCYRMLNEEHGDRLPHGLDLCICFAENSLLSDNPDLGSIQYIDKESGEILVKLPAEPNSLFLAYRTEGASRFIRYIPKSSHLLSQIFWLTITYPVIE